MIRVEIIANHSVEENILDALNHEGVGKYYTKYSNIFGVGTSGPRMGDSIWPEENFALVIWCEEEEARLIQKAVEYVKKIFPDEGVKIFGLPPAAEKSVAAAEKSVVAAEKSEAAADNPESHVTVPPEGKVVVPV